MPFANDNDSIILVYTWRLHNIKLRALVNKSESSLRTPH